MNFVDGLFTPFRALSRKARVYLVAPWVTGVLFIAGFVGCLYLGLLLTDPVRQMIPVYPAAGFAVAAMLRFGWKKFLPWVVLAVVAGGIWEGLFGRYFVVAFGNGAAFALAAWLVERFADGPRFLQRPENVFRFVAAAIVLGTVSAAVGTCVLVAVGDTTFGEFWRHSLGWAVGDVVGVLLVVPPLLAWTEAGEMRRQRTTIRWAEAFLLLIVSVFAVQFAFGGPPFLRHSYGLEYLPIPVLLWAAFRFPRRGGTTVLMLVAVLAIANTAAGHGSFANHPRSSLTLLQAYLGAVSMLVLVVSAGVRDRETHELALRRAIIEAEAARTRAERADRAKSEFLSRMSHELRTPLNAILGFGQLLQLQGSQDEMVDECSGHIVRSGRHLLSLINEVMDIASLQDQQMALSLEPVELAPAVRACVDSLAAESSARGISCRLSFPHRENLPARADGESEERPCVALADRKRLDQILHHLIANAIQYNVEGGQVDIACIFMAGAVDSPGVEEGRWRICVTDSGQGISAEDQARLFTPFERLGAERTNQAGTGLGLTLSRSLIEAMDGQLGVDSALGKGSTFWVELPAVRVEKDVRCGL